MGNDKFVVKKRSTWVSVLKAILIIAVVVFVEYKIYDKFFRKKMRQDALGNSVGEDPAIAEASQEDRSIE